MSYFIQLGAGVGKDGFYKTILRDANENDEIILVEANKFLIKQLESNYKSFKNVQIINKSIIPEGFSKKEVSLYYSEENGPNYEMSSLDKNHLIKHAISENSIKELSVKGITINELLENLNEKEINYLAIDLEGLDEEIIHNINFKKYKIYKITTEHIHMKNRYKIIKKMYQNNYFLFNDEFKSELDLLFIKNKKSFKNLIKKYLKVIYLMTVEKNITRKKSLQIKK